MPEPELPTEAFQSFLEVIAPGKEPNLDIVAVHGLNPTNEPFHAKKTWTAGDKMWLKDFLPDDLPNARVMLFGYNANVAFEPSTSGIHDQAEDLLNRLDLKRRKIPDKNRPIIFIAHSLGGLVVKQALVRGTMGEKYNSIPQATYGIAFFATPHQGSDIGKLGEIAAIISQEVIQKAPTDFLLESIKKDSLYSDELASQFRHQLFNYEVLSFYERRPSKETGCLKTERRIANPDGRDHISICRFTSADGPDYEKAIGNIIHMADNAIDDYEERTKENLDDKLPASTVDSSALLDACSRGDKEDVISLVKSGADVNFEGPRGYTPLMNAVERDDFAMVELLISFKVRVESTSSSEKSPLGIAIANGSLQMTKLLLDNKANINANSVSLQIARAVPLGQAVYAGQEEIVRLLLDRDADVNRVARDAINGWTPLHVAVRKNGKQESVVRLLLERGAKIDKPSAHGDCAVDNIKGLKAHTKAAESKNIPMLPLLPQLLEALSRNLFAEVAGILLSEVSFGAHWKEASKLHGFASNEVLLKHPSGRFYQLKFPLNLMPAPAPAPAWSSTGGAYEIPLNNAPLGQNYHQVQQQQIPHPGSPNPLMRSYTSPQQGPWVAAPPPLPPQQQQQQQWNQAPPMYMPQHAAAMNTPQPLMRSYTTPQPQPVWNGGSSNTYWNQAASQLPEVVANISPVASNMVNRSYTSPQAVEVEGSAGVFAAQGPVAKKGKGKGLLGRMKGAFK